MVSPYCSYYVHQRRYWEIFPCPQDRVKMNINGIVGISILTIMLLWMKRVNGYIFLILYLSLLHLVHRLYWLVMKCVYHLIYRMQLLINLKHHLLNLHHQVTYQSPRWETHHLFKLELLLTTFLYINILPRYLYFVSMNDSKKLFSVMHYWHFNQIIIPYNCNGRYIMIQTFIHGVHVKIMKKVEWLMHHHFQILSNNIMKMKIILFRIILVTRSQWLLNTSNLVLAHLLEVHQSFFMSTT